MDTRPEEVQLLEEWVAAAEDLERAYEIAARTVINVLPNDRLVQS